MSRQTIGKGDFFDNLARHRLYSGILVVPVCDQAQLIQVAKKIQSLRDELKKVYWIDASLKDEHYPSFRSLLITRDVLGMGGSLSFEKALIFPQDSPIVLVVESFDSLTEEDTKMYLNALWKKEDVDYHPRYYLHPNSIIIVSTNNKEITRQHSYKIAFITIAEE
jgi:hypothetical protein